jgi:hypothetical protein
MLWDLYRDCPPIAVKDPPHLASLPEVRSMPADRPDFDLVADSDFAWASVVHGKPF